MIRRLASLLAALALAGTLTGCTGDGGFVASVDQWAFQRFGSTVFAAPEPLTLKEIHLDVGTLAGRDVVVEGKVVGASDHGTYVVLTDDAARLLVVLTDLAEPAPSVTPAQATPRTFRIYGVVESGKKGLPFVRAHAVQAVETKA